MVGKMVVGKFGKVVGIPEGGTRFATFMRSLTDKDSRRTLVVDDVLTTGKSMRAALEREDVDAIGLVIFARGPCPRRVQAIFTLALAAGLT